MARTVQWPRWRRSSGFAAQQPSAHAPPARKRTLGLAASFFIASCQQSDRITTDLDVAAPADADIQQVVVPIQGLEFRKSGGGTERLEFSDAEITDLMARLSDEPLRLFTREDLPEGTYTGVRLLFDEDDEDNAYVIDGFGAEQPLSIASGEYAPIDFRVSDDDDADEDAEDEEDSNDTDDQGSGNRSIILTLDLRLSLLVDDDDNYELTPVLRSADTEEAGTLQGTLDAQCVFDDPSAAAVYLFEGEDVTPDDFDDQESEPYATAAVGTDSFGAQYAYEIRSLPAGEYTVAVACDGELEDRDGDDDLDFESAVNVTIEAGEITEQDL